MLYYKAKVKCKIENDKGKVQKVTEEYLVNAVSVTDVEAQITKEMTGAMYEWELISVTETKVLKVLDAN
jgi:hypothetical protein